MLACEVHPDLVEFAWVGGEGQGIALVVYLLQGLVHVLVEGASKRDASVMVGHSEHNQTVHFSAGTFDPAALVGSICDVRVAEARTWYLRGDIEGEPR